INGAIESIRDITKQKQTEQSLLESEEKFRFIFDTQKNGMLIIDATTRTIIDANATAIRLIDMPADQIIGRGCHTFISSQESGMSPATYPCHPDGNAYGTLIDGKGRQILITTDTTEATIGGRKILIETFADIPERTTAE
ncbi:MAG: PAS domain-containing protein, partial [Methanoregula sp.]|nr:PAS domain-containing protein [Methanoregula sp.]